MEGRGWEENSQVCLLTENIFFVKSSDTSKGQSPQKQLTRLVNSLNMLVFEHMS